LCYWLGIIEDVMWTSLWRSPDANWAAVMRLFFPDSPVLSGRPSSGLFRLIISRIYQPPPLVAGLFPPLKLSE
jgi:hypothetical protein